MMHSWVSPQEQAAPTSAQTGVITTSSPCSHTFIQPCDQRPAQVCRCSVPFPGTSRKRLSISLVRKRLVNHITPLRPFLDCTCEVKNTGTSGGSLRSAPQPVIRGLFQSAQVCLHGAGAAVKITSGDNCRCGGHCGAAAEPMPARIRGGLLGCGGVFLML